MGDAQAEFGTQDVGDALGALAQAAAATPHVDSPLAALPAARMSPGLLGGTLTSTGVLGQRPGPRGATERHRPSDHPTLAAPTRDSATPFCHTHIQPVILASAILARMLRDS